MALINCKECGKEMSSSASACPSCGKPAEDVAKKERSKKRGNVQGAGCLIIIVGFVLMLLSPIVGTLALAAGIVVLLIGFFV